MAHSVLSSAIGRQFWFLAGSQPRQANRRSFHFLFSENGCLARSPNVSDLYEAFESEVSQYLALTTKQRLFVHAGVIGWKGHAILLPGHSFTGKTTLVKELLQAGASYYSDEFALLDREGFVHPYQRPLTVRDRSNSKSSRIKAESLGAELGSKPLPVKLVIDTQYRQGAHWKPVALSRGSGALILLANTLAGRKRPQLALDILRKAVSGAEVLRSSRGEASETVGAILQ